MYVSAVAADTGFTYDARISILDMDIPISVANRSQQRNTLTSSAVFSRSD